MWTIALDQFFCLCLAVDARILSPLFGLRELRYAYYGKHFAVIPPEQLHKSLGVVLLNNYLASFGGGFVLVS